MPNTAVLVLLLSSFLVPIQAQNLLLPQAWRPGPTNPALCLNLNINPLGQLTFSPHCNLPACAGQWTGIYQDVQVPSSGWYQLTMAGYCGGTGSFAFELVVDSQVQWKYRQEGLLMFNDKVYLNSGTRRIELRSTTSSIMDDKWLLRPPTLEPAFLPVVEVRASHGNGSSLEFDMNASAVLLGVSARTLAAPIRIPGMQHGLVLDPATMLVVTPQTNFLAALQAQQMWRWPKLYVQAVSPQRFGSVVQLQY